MYREVFLFIHVIGSRRDAGRTSIVIIKHLLCFELNTKVNVFTQGPAQPAVDGTAWDFDGVKRWHWMHDGRKVNGWIEFQSGGILRTSFEKEDNKNEMWNFTSNGNIMATFGNCHHYLQLPDDEKPEFYVFERILLNGSFARGLCHTRGVLSTLTPRPPTYAPPLSLQV